MLNSKKELCVVHIHDKVLVWRSWVQFPLSSVEFFNLTMSLCDKQFFVSIISTTQVKAILKMLNCLVHFQNFWIIVKQATFLRGVTANVLVLLHYAIHLPITNTPNCHYIQWCSPLSHFGCKAFQGISYSCDKTWKFWNPSARRPASLLQSRSMVTSIFL